MAEVWLLLGKDEVGALLAQQAFKGDRLVQEIDVGLLDTDPIKQDYFSWDDYNIRLLERAFQTDGGWLTTTPVGEYRRIALQVMDLHVNRAGKIPLDRLDDIRRDVLEKSRYLESLITRLDLYAPVSSTVTESSKNTGAIFLVHGHNLLLRETVRRFLEGVTDRPVVVLDDQANKGRDVLGKLLDKAYEAAFAVVLLTGDDQGYPTGSTGAPRPRARQNVIFELGLFLGLIGRDKVAVLYEDGVEIPSDYSGVLYIKLDDGGWQLRLARELNEAGIAVDMNKLV